MRKICYNSIDKCKNEIEGHVYYPTLRDKYLEFYYKQCKHFKEKVDKKLENPQKKLQELRSRANDITGKPILENPIQVNPIKENHAQLNTKELNKEE